MQEKRSCELIVVLETKSCPLAFCNRSSEELHVLWDLLTSHCVSSLRESSPKRSNFSGEVGEHLVILKKVLVGMLWL